MSRLLFLAASFASVWVFLGLGCVLAASWSLLGCCFGRCVSYDARQRFGIVFPSSWLFFLLRLGGVYGLWLRRRGCFLGASCQRFWPLAASWPRLGCVSAAFLAVSWQRVGCCLAASRLHLCCVLAASWLAVSNHFRWLCLSCCCSRTALHKF